MVSNIVTSLLRMYEKKLSSKQRVKLRNCNWQLNVGLLLLRSHYRPRVITMEEGNNYILCEPSEHI